MMNNCLAMLIVISWHFLVNRIDDSSAVKVIDCIQNMKEELYAGIYRYDFKFDALKPFSSCVRFQFKKLQRGNLLVESNSSTSRPQFLMRINVDHVVIAVAQEYRYIMLETWFKPYKWYQMCVVHDATDGGGIRTYINANLISTDYLRLNWKSETDLLTVGYLDPEIYRGFKFLGNVTQMNIWSRVLTDNELQNLAHCKIDLQGDLISWENEKWETKFIKVYNVSLESLCQEEVQLETHLLSKMSFYEGAFVCAGIGGGLITPNSLSYGQELYKWAKASVSEQLCTHYWVGIYDDVTEGVWQYYANQSVSVELPWAPDEPNGIHFENCGGLDFEGIIDDSCTTLRCPFCAVRPNLPWLFYGTCEDKAFNTIFSLEMKLNRWVFQGYADYVIIKELDGSWAWKLADRNKTLAILDRNTKYYYPIGRKLWQLQEPICKQKTGYRSILLSVCKENQFSCDDGTCIDHTNHCDLKYDCRDNSDELNCNLIRYPSDYKANISPRGEGTSSSSLQISAEIGLETLRIDANDMLLEVSFNLTLIWHENRAIFANLKKDSSLNIIPTSNLSLWTPSISFTNTGNNAGTTVDDLTSIHVQHVKQSNQEDKSVPEHVTLYEGSKNPIVSHRKYQAHFTCDFDLISYPFDNQLCFMNLRLRSATAGVLEFNATSSLAKYLGNVLLLEYEVGNVFLTTFLDGDYSALKVHIPMSRLHGYAYINIYLPTITMLIIGFSTLYFKQDIFEVRIMTALTTLLVMATLFTQVAASLPKTSYFKMVDIWFLYCIFSIFFIIVFHLLTDLLIPGPSYGTNEYFAAQQYSITKVMPFKASTSTQKKSNNLDAATRMERFGRRFIAFAGFVFNVTYWMIIYLR